MAREPGQCNLYQAKKRFKVFCDIKIKRSFYFHAIYGSSQVLLCGYFVATRNSLTHPWYNDSASASDWPTCTAATREVVSEKSLKVDRPHSERVVWSRSQTVHSDAVRYSWHGSWVANKMIARRWLNLAPGERQRLVCWAYKLAQSRNIRFW